MAEEVPHIRPRPVVCNRCRATVPLKFIRLTKGRGSTLLPFMFTLPFGWTADQLDEPDEGISKFVFHCPRCQ